MCTYIYINFHIIIRKLGTLMMYVENITSQSLSVGQEHKNFLSDICFTIYYLHIHVNLSQSSACGKFTAN